MDTLTLTSSEQEYIKQIYLFTLDKEKNILTKELASLVNTRPSSVTDMVKKLAEKELVVYNKHYGCTLSDKGMREALYIIRRNRLWELFLFEKLAMDWKEIDSTASKLQSITSEALTEKLSEFLGNPTYDPHGEAIPTNKGVMPRVDSLEVYDLKLNQTAKIFGYRDTSPIFLEYIEKLNLFIGKSIKIVGLITYNNSLEVVVDGKYTHILSQDVAQKIYVK